MRHLRLRSALAVLFLVGMLLTPWGGALAGPPKLPPPPKAAVGLLGKDMIFNGIPMEVRQFQTPLSEGEVLRYYMEYWPPGTRDKPGYVMTDAMEPWKILTRVENGYLMTVQLAPQGSGTRGFLAVSRMPDPDSKVDIGSGFPVMHGSTALNDIQTDDLGKEGRTLAYVNDHTADANANYYRNWFQDRGWTADMDKAPGEQARILSFSRGNKGVNIVINGRSGRTYIVAQTTNFEK